MRKTCLAAAVAAQLMMVPPALAAPEGSPGEGPWRMSVQTNEMTDSRTESMIAELSANDGTPFEITMDCDSSTPAAILGVLAKGGRKYRVAENTTINGMFGSYTQNTTTRVGVLFRFDHDDASSQAVSNDYANHFALIFANSRALNRRLDPSSQRGPANPQAIGAMLLGFATKLVNSGDAGDLLDHEVLRVQMTMSDGSTPIVAIPLAANVKGFVARCAVPERARAGGVTASAPQFSGTYSDGQHTIAFAHGMATYDGMAMTAAPFSIDGNAITVSMPGNDTIRMTLVDINHITADNGRSTLTRVPLLDMTTQPVPLAGAGSASLHGTFTLPQTKARLVLQDGRATLYSSEGKILVGSRFELEGSNILTHFVSASMTDHLLTVIDADHIGQLSQDGSRKGDEWTFVRTAP